MPGPMRSTVLVAAVVVVVVVVVVEVFFPSVFITRTRATRLRRRPTRMVRRVGAWRSEAGGRRRRRRRRRRGFPCVGSLHPHPFQKSRQLFPVTPRQVQLRGSAEIPRDLSQEHEQLQAAVEVDAPDEALDADGRLYQEKAFRHKGAYAHAGAVRSPRALDHGRGRRLPDDFPREHHQGVLGSRNVRRDGHGGRWR